MPDSDATRLRELEKASAALNQRVQDLVGEVHNVAAATGLCQTGITGLQVTAARIDESINHFVAELEEVKVTLQARDKESSDERRSVKVALIALTGTIAAAVIAGIVAIALAKLGTPVR